MSDLLQIALTTMFTLIGGTLLFIFGEFLRILVVIPLQKYKEQVQVTLDHLDFYANYVTNFFSAEPTDEERDMIKQINKDFRSTATQLRSKYVGISYRKLLIKLKVVPSQNKLDKAYGSLILISNNIPREGSHLNKSKIDPIMTNHDSIEAVKTALKP